MRRTTQGLTNNDRMLSACLSSARGANTCAYRIIRILFMVPVYAMVSCVSLYYYKHDVYFEAIRDCYEAFAIASFFTLVCHYIAPDLHDQKEYFRGIKPKPWVWPMNWLKRVWGGDKGPWRTPRSGLTWFNVKNLLLMNQEFGTDNR